MASTLTDKALTAWYAEENRSRFLATAVLLTMAISLLDWQITTNVGLGFLYLIPIMLASAFLTRWQILVVALVCAGLREVFSFFPHNLAAIPRTGNVALGFLATGLLVREMAQSRRLSLKHLKQLEHQVRLRRDAEEELRVLIESSPAAILAIDSDGRILLANEAASQMLACDGPTLQGDRIERYLPVLATVQRKDQRDEQFRTAMESRGRRASGEAFLAHIWLSTYQTSSGPRLAAVVMDGSEELRDREEAGLHQMLTNSRILVGAVSHEIRNLSGAIAIVHANLGRVPDLVANEDFQALGSLVQAVQRVAAAELRTPYEKMVGWVELRTVLDDLSIVIEPSFRDSGAEIEWHVPESLPPVRGTHHGILQVLLNLAQNSLRAMENSPRKVLSIDVSCDRGSVVVRIHDTGPGVPRPELLFRPFQQGAEITGLGLYVSRAIVHSFAGELRHEPQPQGACFAVELMPRETQPAVRP